MKEEYVATIWKDISVIILVRMLTLHDHKFVSDIIFVGSSSWLHTWHFVVLQRWPPFSEIIGSNQRQIWIVYSLILTREEKPIIVFLVSYHGLFSPSCTHKHTQQKQSSCFSSSAAWVLEGKEKSISSRISLFPPPKKKTCIFAWIIYSSGHLTYDKVQNFCQVRNLVFLHLVLCKTASRHCHLPVRWRKQHRSWEPWTAAVRWMVPATKQR